MNRNGMFVNFRGLYRRPISYHVIIFPAIFSHSIESESYSIVTLYFINMQGVFDLCVLIFVQLQIAKWEFHGTRGTIMKNGPVQ